MNSLEQVEQKIFSNISWDKIDKKQARSEHQNMKLLREACLVESYFGVYIGHMIDLFWYDLEATCMYTVEGFEAYMHYYILRKYLDTIEYENPIRDEEIVKLREKDKNLVLDDEVKELVNFMATEHFAANFFADISEMTKEPVLKKILHNMSEQEVTHSKFAYDLLKKRLENDPSIKEKILSEAKNFQHVGAYVLPTVHAAKEDNIKIIQGFNQKIKKLTGKSLSEFTQRKEND